MSGSHLTEGKEEDCVMLMSKSMNGVSLDTMAGLGPWAWSHGSKSLNQLVSKAAGSTGLASMDHEDQRGACSRAIPSIGYIRERS